MKFGTVGARKGDQVLEITTFREEVYAEEHRKPAVTFGKDLQTDLSRRDFTVNAMAIRLPEGEFVDPFGGVKDLAAKRLDTPLDPEIAFSDDPLRMLRAARFAAQLELVPAPRVVRAIEQMHDRLEIVSAERISDELTKLLTAPRPLARTRAGGRDRSRAGVPARARRRCSSSRTPCTSTRTCCTTRSRSSRRPRPTRTIRRSGSRRCSTTSASRRRARSRPTASRSTTTRSSGARMARERLQALRYPAHVVDDVARLVEMHLRFHGYTEWSDSAVRRYVRDAGPLLDKLNQLTRADCTTQNRFKAKKLEALQDDLEERIARLAEEENLDAMRPPLDGVQVMEHLGIPPGPEVGRALDHLMELRLERGPIDEDEAFRQLDEWWRPSETPRASDSARPCPPPRA